MRSVPSATPLAREAAGLDACVHCGFCLTACPTYLSLEDENESPRGRLVLMRSLLDGALDADDAALAHLDRCLGCRACETACPSGVPYGHLLEATRATLAPVRGLPWRARVVLLVFARPWLTSLAMAMARMVRATGIARWLARHGGPRAFPFAMLAATERRTTVPSAPRTAFRAPAAADDSAHRLSPAHNGGARAVVFTGCVMEGLLAPVNRATEQVLVANGYEVTSDRSAGCCGALHAHAGSADTARALARRVIAACESSGDDAIVVNAAGCGSLMKEYPHLFADDAAWRARAERFSARVRDVSELLAHAGPRPGKSPAVRVAYDAPCHLQHAQRITEPPMRVLAALEGAEVVPLTGADQCCGSAGIYNLIEPDVAAGVLAPKLAAIAAAQVDVVATGNPGCLMQIGGGLIASGSTVRARHPVELLAEAYDTGTREETHGA